MRETGGSGGEESYGEHTTKLVEIGHWEGEDLVFFRCDWRVRGLSVELLFCGGVEVEDIETDWFWSRCVEYCGHESSVGYAEDVHNNSELGIWATTGVCTGECGA
ncbi:hypothetical protein Tco_0291141 [Tanacetum coccineum]